MEQTDLFSPAPSGSPDGLFLAWLGSVRFWLAHLPTAVPVRPFEVRPLYDAAKSPRQVAEALALKAKFTQADILANFGRETHGGY